MTDEPDTPTDPPLESEAERAMIQRCEAQGLRLTGQRRVVARVLAAADDHPDVEELHRRATALDPKISLATIYRTVKLFEEAGLLERHEFRDGRARYEDAERAHHDHLIDVTTGRVIEFVDPEIERLQRAIAARHGFRLIDHRLELYAVPIDAEDADAEEDGDTRDAERGPS
ncbi:MAG: Fur family transcriptional regulator [Pseudomonadota bacterium]